MNNNNNFKNPLYEAQKSSVSNKIANDIKDYCYKFGYIGSIYCSYTTFLGVLGSKSINQGLLCIATYPLNVLNIGLLGACSGFVYSGFYIHKLHEKHPDQMADHMSCIGNILLNDSYNYFKKK